jgi:ribonuclease VapC
MVLDTSALLAILLGEPEAAAIAQAIVSDPTRLLSAVSEVETAIVIAARKGAAGTAELDLLRAWAEIETVSMNADQVRLAREAYGRFGKGRHAAALNLGDCCSYALARYRGEPLLFKGNDFAQTDISVVSY